MKRFLLTAFVALATLLLANPLAAWDPVLLPESGRSYVSPQLDGPRYDSMRKCLEKDYASGAQFWAAVVNVSDRTGRDTPAANDAVPFVDHVYQLWRDSDVPIDPDQHILIGLGLKNRAVAIHPGGRWAAMGFEKSRITNAIDRSPFKQHARAGNYEKAVCALAGSIDAELLQIIRTEAKIKKSLGASLAELRNDVERLEERVRGMALESGVINEQLERLDAQRRQLDRAQRHFEAGTLMDARDLKNEIESVLREVKRKLERHEEATAELARLTTRSEKLHDEAKERDEALALGVGNTFPRLGRCTDLMSESRDRVARLEPAQLHNVETCLDNARREMNNSELKNTFATRVFPAGLLIALLLALAFWLFRRSRRRKRAMRDFDAKSRLWDTQLGSASARLLDLERTYPSYFGPTKVAWEGKSQDLDQACADAVNQVFLLLNEATELHERACDLVDEAGAFDFKSVERANVLLTTEEVVFETGEKEQRRRIFLPLTQEYRGSAGQLLHDLQDRYVETRRLLDRVTEIEESSLESASETRRVADSITELSEARAELGGDPSVLLDPAEEPLERCAEAAAIAPTDPIAANEAFEEHLATLQQIEERGELGNNVLRDFDEIAAPMGRELVGEIARLRAGGLRLREDGFHPDVMLEQARNGMNEAREHVVDGEETLGKALADRVHAILQDVRAKVEASVEGRAEIPGVVKEQRAIRGKIADRVPSAAEALAELQAEHAPESYSGVAKNLTESERLLAGIPSWCDGILTAHAEQAYLSAWTDVEAAWTRLRKADHLLDDLHARLEAVTAAREACQQRQNQIEERFASLESREDDPYLGTAWREDFSVARNAWSHVVEEMATEKPDWPECAAQSAVVWSDLESLLARAEEFETAWEQARDRFDSVSRQLEGLSADVRREVRDRPHVGQAVARLEQRREYVNDRLRDRQANGKQMAMDVEKFHSEYKWAMGVWAAEMKLVRHASAELSRVDQLVARRERSASSYGYGVRGDFDPARSLVHDARQLADRREWEEVLATVAEAQRVADAEDDRCEAEADRKRRAAQRKARLARQRSSYSSSSSSYSSSSSFSSSSSSSSFSSGSSFSSSSGGSSFGSSSGGSSW